MWPTTFAPDFIAIRIFVVGDSWGSILGIWLAHEHPDLATTRSLIGTPCAKHAFTTGSLPFRRCKRWRPIRAEKAFVSSDDAGHFPFFEDAANFTDQLARRVLPFAR